MSHRAAWLLLAVAAQACEPPTDDDPVDSDPDTDLADTDPIVTGGDFSFVVFADPHVTSDSDHADRLREAVAWVEREREARGIELVLVAGDTAWSQGLPIFVDVMDDLSIPWVPMIGDNEIQVGDEEAYHEAVSPQLEALGADLPGWTRLDAPVANPETGRDAWFQGFGFTWGGVTFVGFDIAARVIDPLWGEFAYLHDFPGGSLPFLAERLDALPVGPREDVVVLTHNPMLWTAGGFDPVAQERLMEVVEPYGDRVALALGGHLHLDVEWVEDAQPYEVALTDAIWDDEIRVRVVDVTLDGRTFRYAHETVVVERTGG